MSKGTAFHSTSLYHFLMVAGTAWWSKGLMVIIGTFILEDATTMIAAMAAGDGRISVPVALVSLYIGVAVGDLGLYGLGALGSAWAPARRWLTLPRNDRGRVWFHRNVVRTVVISRFIPGARLPLYTACGFFRAPFGWFAGSAVIATLIWTSLLFSLALHIGGWMGAHMASWRWFGIGGFILTILFVGRLVSRFQTFSD